MTAPVEFTLSDRAKAALAACNVQEAEFARAYVKCAETSGKARLAAHAAGYCANKPDSPKRNASLAAIGCKVANRPHVRETIEALQECIAVAVCVDIAWWKKENVDLLNVCKKMVPVVSITGEKLYDKPLDAKAAGAALDRIGRHLGAYEKSEGKSLNDALSELLATINGARQYSDQSGGA